MLSGFAALRAPHPSSPARRGGAKQIEAQRPAAFLAFSVQGLTGAGLPTVLYEKKAQRKALSFNLFAEREALEPMLSENIIKLQITDNHILSTIRSKSKSF